MPPKFNRGRATHAGPCMLSCLCVFIGVVYFAYAMTCLRPLLFPEVEVAGVVIMAVFHVILSLLLTSLYKVVRTDPGPVPPNWGYYVGDEQKRRRYCSACNLWKPDRTHHCSVCNRCTLNMDHHCPWVNNCVGFWNRKFFIQFLLYAILCVGLVSFHGLYFLVVDGYFFWSDIDQDPYRASEEWLAITFYIIFVVVLFFCVTLFFALIPFTRIHLWFLTHNLTTVENMTPEQREKRKYDLGCMRNVEQVFGPNWLLWWLPAHTAASRPVGDGVRWRVRGQ